MSAIELLESGQIDIADAPKELFKCIVMFKETLTNNRPLLGIGWMHPTGHFESDAKFFDKFTPIKFIQLYSDNTHA